MRKPYLKDLFTFSRSERRGIILLSLIIILLLLFPLLWPFIHHKKKVDFADFKKEIAAFEALKDSVPAKGNLYKAVNNKWLQPDSLFNFDPNTLTTTGWKKLGLPPYLILTIQHYLAKGGHFYKPADIRKIYGLSDKDYQVLEPYIKIKNQEKISYKKRQQAYDDHKNYSIESIALHSIAINTADSATLIKLPGIGPVFSARIIHFRKALGGFYSIDQLSEVYGLEDNVINKISKYFSIDTNLIRKININKVDFKTLLHHPYVNYNLTRAIFNYREQHGPFRWLSDLKKVKLVDEEIYRKLVHYLVVN